MVQTELARAESSATLQAQRCAALEDRVTELEAALVGARDQRDRAKAEAESAQAEASRAFDELESERSKASTTSEPVASGPSDGSMAQALQAKLLEVERLRSERDGLRRSLDEWRRQAQTFRRNRDELHITLERLEDEHKQVVERSTTDSQRLAELQREVDAQARELELAERRTRHLREHIAS